MIFKCSKYVGTGVSTFLKPNLAPKCVVNVLSQFRQYIIDNGIIRKIQ